jgi:beta-lactamase class A
MTILSKAISIIVNRYALLAVLGLSLISENAFSQKEALRSEIEKIAKTAGGKVGVSLASLEGDDTLTINGQAHFPMQSVYKFPLAMAVLHAVDNGKLSLDQKIHLNKKDLHEDTWSPMRDSFPKGNVDVTLRDLLYYSVTYSDNNACDILFRVIGGPAKVQEYLRSLSIKNIDVATTEQDMHDSWNAQFHNWCEPVAMTELLKIFYERKHLAASSSDLLWKLMTESENSPKRIRGLLPESVIVAHKTGTSNTNDKGVNAATNDVGIVTMPNGKHFSIVVYVSMSKKNLDTREAVIAKIAKAAWDYYSIKQ